MLLIYFKNYLKIKKLKELLNKLKELLSILILILFVLVRFKIAVY